MGIVYRAEDKRIGRPVAIKTLTEGFSGEPEMLERFYREAQAGILQHPNIVIVYDLGDEDGMPFIVMEHVNGEPLDRIIASGRQLPLIEKLSIIEQVCAGLGYAHQRGIVHRDIKPANVIVQPDGHAKIVDFGIARVQRATAETELTRAGSVIGTIHYIAPERLKGQAFDGRSDIFSAGIMLYQLLAGQLPFAGEDMTVLHKLANEPHPPLRTFVASYPPALDEILDRALAKDPARRYATAEEFAAELHAVGEAARMPAARPRRRRFAPVLAVIALLLCVAAAGAAWWYYRQAVRRHQQQTAAAVGLTATHPASAPAPVVTPAEAPAHLVIHSTPGAEVSIDNAPQGQTDEQGNLTVQAKPGAGTLAVTLDGYQPASQPFTVKAGDQVNVAVPLSPVPPPEKAAPAPAAQPVHIVSFSAADSQVEEGQLTTLRWQTENASNVSIDNGIARVAARGEITVHPAVTTTWLLTAKGNGGVQQKAVTVVVQPKVPAAKAPEPVDESGALLAEIRRFQTAYNAHDLAGMQAVWTSLKAQQVLGLASFFRGNPGARIADQCGIPDLSISGDSATWTCAETTTLLAGGKPMNHTQNIRYAFIRRNGNWTIQDRR